MSIEVVLEGKLEKEKDRESFSALLKDLCENKKVKIEDYDTTVIIEVCPEGYIECGYEGVYVSIAAQTNIAGPGFHAFVCSLYDDIIMRSGISFEVSDPTKYYEERNFENLKHQYFYQWLENIRSYIREYPEAQGSLCISWPLDYYQPMPKEGHVVTPMGYFSIEDIDSFDIMDLAERFFIWNEEKRDAKYYRNCALSLLWKECYFDYSGMNEYSAKIAHTILDYLEAAYESDDTLPLPMQAYQQLCQALHRDVLIRHGDDMHCGTIGYRQNDIRIPLGNWHIPVDGYSEQSFDRTTQTLHIMAPYQSVDEPWHWMIKANAYTFENTQCSFLEVLEHPKEDVLDYFTYENDDVIVKGIVEKTDDYYTLLMQANCEYDTLLLECVIKDYEDIAKIRQWGEEVIHRVVTKDDIQH